MGILDVLTLIFIVLKVTGLVDWSWIIVLSPTWVWVLFIFGTVALKRTTRKIEWKFKN